MFFVEANSRLFQVQVQVQVLLVCVKVLAYDFLGQIGGAAEFFQVGFLMWFELAATGLSASRRSAVEKWKA